MKIISIKNPRRLFFAMAIPVAACIIQIILWEQIQPSIWFFFWPALFFSIMIDGIRGAFISTILSVIFVNIFFHSTQLSFRSVYLEHSNIVFVLLGLLAGFLHEYYYSITKRKHFEETLWETENKYRKIVETSLEGIIIASPDSKIIFTNNKFADMLGYPTDEILGRSASDFTPDEQSCSACMGNESSGPDHNVQDVLRFTRKDGSIIWALCNATPLLDENGIKKGNLLMLTDITERKKLEDELESREHLYSLMIKNLPNSLIHIIDRNFRFIQSGGNQLYKIGYTSESLRGKRVSDVLPAEITGIIGPLLNKAFEGEESACETFFRDLFWLNIFVPVPSPAGKIENVMLLAVNITKLKNTENELLIAQEKLKLAIENADIGLWEWRLDTDEVFLNERTEKMLGIETGKGCYTYTDFENYIQEEDVPYLKKAFASTIKSGSQTEAIFRTRQNASEMKYIFAKALLNRSVEGKPEKLTVTFSDITSIKKGTEKVLFKLIDELTLSNKDLKQFVEVASHDLQEPLRMVSSFTQMLAQRYRDKIDKDGMEYIMYAVEGANRMYSMINGIAAYSRVQVKGKVAKKLKMNEVLEKTKKLLILKIMEKQAIIESKKLPVVYADENQMIQLFQNLIDNSLKFSRDIPRIHISWRSSDDYYTFIINDNGPGIEPQYFERIFKMFERLNQDEAIAGTGMGLALCKRIVEGHGGSIWVESEPGKGASFFFTLPKYKFITL